MRLSPIALTIASLCAINTSQAQQTTAKENNDSIEVITISAPRTNTSDTATAQGNLVKPDVADWLTTVPGANINKNGPITGIAQYRGMYGDRVSKSIDGHQIIGAGPNAMDAPLTYVNPIMIDSVSVYRGIAPVSAGIDTLGGAIDVSLKQARPSTGSLSIDGDLATSYNNINDATTYAGLAHLSGGNAALMVYLSDQQGNNYEDGSSNVIKSTKYDRQQLGVDGRYQFDRTTIGLSWHQSKTDPSGTPALPMDIDYIDSTRWNTDGEWENNQWTIDWKFGYQDATHGMDNYSQRTNMMAPMHRYNTAKAKTVDYRLRVSNDLWLFALEGFDATHDSVITNPNNAMFEVVNFNKVKDIRHSALIQFSLDQGDKSHTIGLRVKHNSSDADDIASTMTMMSPAAKALQDRFNQSDRSVSDVTADLVVNSQYELNNNSHFSLGLGIKQRAPSYQERYLWLPMQATGGLADGKTYVGDINLKPETAYQIDLGLTIIDDNFSVSPHLFAQRVDNYIQGAPTSDMQVNMVSSMMNNNDPLQFSNIDAVIYGADINWDYQLSPQLKLTGIASYVRGERQDTKDDLYRMAPLNARMSAIYSAKQWQTSLSLHAYHKQTHVAALNNESVSPGYTIIDWQAHYELTDGLLAKVGVNNLTDKTYSPHLGGVNRANGSDIAVGQRLNSAGRNLYIALDYQF